MKLLSAILSLTALPALLLAQPFNPGGGGGGGGGGASSTSQLTDLKAVRTSSTVLAVGASCTSSAPCNLKFGDAVVPVTTAATVTLSSTPTGAVYGWATGAGAVTIGVPGGFTTVTCNANCTVTTATSIPANTIPIFTWQSTSGAWATTGTDLRSFQSLGKTISVSGTGAPAITQTTTNIDLGFSAATGPPYTQSYTNFVTITQAGFAETTPVTITACAGVVCSCMFTSDFGATATGLPRYRLLYTNRRTSEAISTLYANGGSPGNAQTIPAIFDSAAATSPVWSILNADAASSTIGAAIICSVVN